ncbi:MAG: FAD binding domain-containing protein [Chloroflexi bacterium]|nr:FAD binding domain-containing protein [Chloroflexota bacterium]
MVARPGLPDIEYVKAESSRDVFKWMNDKGENLKLLMGGMDLFIQLRDRGEGPDFLLDVKDLPGIQEISLDQKNGLKVGAQ